MHRVQDLGARTRGVWTRAAALRVASPAVVRARVASGTWQRPWPGVYADGGLVLDAEQRAFAAVLASGGEDQPRRDAQGRVRLRALACGRTAARVHGFVLIDDDDPVTGAREHLQDEVAGWEHGRHLGQLPGPVLRRRQPVLEDGDLALAPSGLWLTSRARTVADCAGLLSSEALVCLVDDALHRGLVPLAELERRAEGARSPVLGQALLLADARAESPGETLARLLLRRVLPGLVPQVRVRDRAGRIVARVDLGDEVLRLAVEMDGRRGHAGWARVADDHRRDAGTTALGWRTERGTWWDVRRGQAAFVRRVLTRAGHAAA